LEISGEVELISDKTITGGPVTIEGEFYAGEHTLSLGGDLIIEADAVFNKGTSNLVFNGPSTQTITLPPPNPHPVRFANITVGNPEGVSINQDIQVRNTLSMQSGNIFNEGKTITVGESVENVGNVIHNGGSIHGELRRWIPSTVTSEINNDFFTLERSRDAMDSEIIGFVEGAGNSSQTLHYEFVDYDPLPGISYYRLKQTDFDGSYEYSQWVAVEVNDLKGRLEALAISQPKGLMLRIFTPTGHPLQVQLADIYGRIVHSQELSPGSPGQIETFVPMPQSARSVLLYRITDGLDFATGKVVR